MSHQEILSKYAGTISRIKEELGRINTPERNYQSLFDEYVNNPKNRQLAKILQREADQGTTLVEEWQVRLDKWDSTRKRKPSEKAKNQVVPVVDYQELKTKRQQLEEELKQVAEQLEQHKFDDFDQAVKSLLSDGVTKEELINRINVE